MAKKTGYSFFMGKALLPVAPEKITMKIKGQNKTVNLINEGEVNILKKPGLTEIEFECYIPQVKQPYAKYRSGFKKANYYLKKFKTWKTKKKKFQFIISRKNPKGKTFFNTNMTVTLEEYDIIEDAGEGFDLKVKIKLKQWRNYGTKTVKVKIKSNKPKVTEQSIPREQDNSPQPESPQMYTVVAGDCLWNIAKNFYGDGSQWEKIYNANTDVCGQPYQSGGTTYVMIHPGDVLVIPA